MGQHAPWVGFRAHAHMSQWEGALPRLRCNIGGKMQGACHVLSYSALRVAWSPALRMKINGYESL